MGGGEISFEEGLRAFLAHWRAGLAAFLLILVLAAGVTAASPPSFESRATVMVLAERDVVLVYAQGSKFAEAVANRSEVAAFASDPVAVQGALRATSRIAWVGSAEHDLVDIRVRWPTPEGAASLAGAAVAQLEADRPRFENVTSAKLWAGALAASGGNESAARGMIQTTLRGTEYVRVLEPPAAVGDPTGRPWMRNLTLGSALAVTAAMATPFALVALKKSARLHKG